MDRLTRISSGVCETSSGAWGIVPLKRTGTSDGTSWFQFKGSTFGHAIRVEWKADERVIVIDTDTARTMINARYARHPNDGELAAYNAVADEANEIMAASKPLLSQKPVSASQDATDENPTPDSQKQDEPRQQAKSARKQQSKAETSDKGD